MRSGDDMKKNELMILCGILILIIGFWGLSELYRINMRAQVQDPSEVRVQVVYKDEVVLRIDPSVDGEYWFDGSYGKLMVQVKDNQWRVTEEECPNHICSSIGWVSVEDYFPIVCLPNEIAVVIE